MLESGISLIQVIKDKLHLLCQREGLEFKPDHNMALMIERLSIAVNALCITGIFQLQSSLNYVLIFLLGDDMDHVVCLTCGMCPKMVLSDGNAKVLFLDVNFIDLLLCSFIFKSYRIQLQSPKTWCMTLTKLTPQQFQHLLILR